VKYPIIPALLAATVSLLAASDAEAAPPLWFDDSDTAFSIVNTYDTKDGVQFNPGWALRIQYVLRGEQKRQPGSTIKLTIKQGGKVKGELICAVPDVMTDYAGDTCYEAKQKLQLTGEIDIDAVYIDGASDAATPLRSYKLKVMTATQVRGNLAPGASTQYVSWHGRTLENFLVPGQQNRLHLWVRYAAPYESGPPSLLDTAMFCSVDGKLLPAVNYDRPMHGDGSLPEQTIARSAQDGQMTKNEYNKFGGQIIRMPLTWGNEEERFKQLWSIDDNPGKWECKWKHKGKALRVFRFTVAGGKVLPHPEQAAGLNLPAGVNLIETEIPADSVLDDVVAADEIVKGSFFGRPWATPEGKAMAAAVKSKGTVHFPQPKALDFGKPIKKWTFGK
jgi:hypothetical protein